MSSVDGWPPRDQHLQAALRHAPDRDLQPPAALSARILEQARRKAAPAPWPARWLARMLRPAGTAAFAGVLLAGVIGLMWRGEVPPSTAEKDSSAGPGTTKPDRSVTPPTEASGGDDREAKVQAAAGAAVSAPAAPDVAAVKRSGPSPASSAGAGPRAPALAELRRQETIRDRPGAEDAAVERAESAARERNDVAGSRASVTPGDAIVRPQAPPAPALPPDPLDAVIARLRGAGTPAASLERWVQLQAAAKGRWQRLGDAERPRGTEVRTPQGVLLGWLAVDAPQVRWQAVADDSVWQVEVPAALAERLATGWPR